MSEFWETLWDCHGGSPSQGRGEQRPTSEFDLAEPGGIHFRVGPFADPRSCILRPRNVGRAMGIRHGADGRAQVAPRHGRHGRLAPSRPRGVIYEREYSRPGILVCVPFGPFAEELWPQLARPERLDPQDRLDCLLQVFRIHRPLAVGRLERIEGLDAEGAEEVHVLTAEKAELLGLPPPSHPIARPSERKPRVARPGQRLWLLRAQSDPTAARPVGDDAVDDDSRSQG